MVNHNNKSVFILDSNEEDLCCLQSSLCSLSTPKQNQTNYPMDLLKSKTHKAPKIRYATIIKTFLGLPKDDSNFKYCLFKKLLRKVLQMNPYAQAQRRLGQNEGSRIALREDGQWPGSHTTLVLLKSSTKEKCYDVFKQLKHMHCLWLCQ